MPTPYLHAPLQGALPVLVLVLLAGAVHAQNLTPQVVSAARVNTSQPLRTMVPHQALPRDYPYLVPNKLHRFDNRAPAPDRPDFSDPVLDTGVQSAGGVGSGTVMRNFDGVSSHGVIPPDTNGDIGPNHYVQWINLQAQIFDRDGTSLLGPVPGNQFFTGLGGRCETRNDGDPIVLYDHLADRWVVMQFQLEHYQTGSGSDGLCIAVSATPDPTGAYHQYDFPFVYFPDYPKLGVWPDAYYATTRSFFRPPTGNEFAQEAVAFEREKMLAGLPAQMQLFIIPGSDSAQPGFDSDGFLPADLDGPAPPPGTPGLFAGFPSYASPAAGREELRLYGFHVDWDTPANSTFSSLGTLPTASFGFSDSDVPQPAGGSQPLDRLPFFSMFRLVYRNMGSHQTLLLNHTVDVSGRAAVRWYELRDSAAPLGITTWSIHQQGTYAPADPHHRWMASMAMNGVGDIALGYSVSSSTLFPSIRYTGQTADMSGTGVMNVPETEIIAGLGSQTHSSGRWGDYSMMAVDPADDETFWYTNEYYPSTSLGNFRTRIAHLSLDPYAFVMTPLDAPGGNRIPQPVAVPAGGTKVPFAGEIFNRTGAPLATQIWPSITFPNGTVVVKNRAQSVNIADGATLPVTGSFELPASFPAGTYTFTGHMGTHPSGGVAFGSFTVEKAAGPRLGTPALSSAEIAEVDIDKLMVFEPSAVLSPAAGPGAVTPTASATLPPGGVLGSAYPNPFNPIAIVPFELAAAGAVRLAVYDVLGREVAVLVDRLTEAGTHTAVFDGASLPSGTYLVRFTAPDGQAQTQRLTLLK